MRVGFKPNNESPSRRSFVTSGNPWLLFLAWAVLCCIPFYKTLAMLVRHSLANDNASHILLIPFIVAWLIYLDRHKIVPRPLDLAGAACFALPAIAFAFVTIRAPFAGVTVSLAVAALSLIFFLVAGFVALFGRVSAGSVCFSLAILLFMVPLPEPILNRVIYLLQAGSAAVAELLFDWTGVPVLREGFVFHLPTMNIEVAQECSGIRSSMALLILALLLAHFSFSKFWKKAVFVGFGLLMMLVKNGVRIATLTVLGTYVDPGFLEGHLHRDGGVVFFLIGLALLWPVYWWLRRGEKPLSSPRPEGLLSSINNLAK